MVKIGIKKITTSHGFYSFTNYIDSLDNRFNIKVKHLPDKGLFLF